MATARRKPGPDGITTTQLAGPVGRFVSRKPLDVEAAVTELREIADERGDLLAERAGVTLGFYARENRDQWPRKALVAALCIAAGADLTRLTEWSFVIVFLPVVHARSGAGAVERLRMARNPLSTAIHPNRTICEMNA